VLYRYQSFDIRIPRVIELTNIPLYNKELHRSFDSSSLTHSDTQDATICSHHYHSKVLPNKRFVFYRLCDIKNDEMQQVVHSNDGKETSCTVSGSV